MQKRSIRELYALGEQACAEKDYSRAFEYFHQKKICIVFQTLSI